jgi:hypothetical protein
LRYQSSEIGLNRRPIEAGELPHIEDLGYTIIRNTEYVSMNSEGLFNNLGSLSFV